MAVQESVKPKVQNNTIVFRAIIWLCITLFYCYQYILRLLPNMIMPELMKQFSINAKEIGLFAGIYYVGYIVMYIPLGILLSRYGTKKVLPLCILLSALGLLPIVYAHSWMYVLIGRLFIGICSSAAVIGAFQAFRVLFPKHFSQMLGAMVCVGILTAIYVSKPLALIRDDIGVFPMLLSVMLGGIFLAIASFLALPQEKGSVTENTVDMVKTILRKPLFWASSIFAGLMVAPLEGFVDTHATAFLLARFAIPRAIGDAISLYILFGMCIGSLVLPYIAEKTKWYYSITAVSSIFMALSFLCMFFCNVSVFWLYILHLIIGICSAYQVIILSKIASYYPAHLAGLAGAMANMIVMSFGYFFNVAIGFSLDHHWDNTLKHGIRIYSKSTYVKALSVIPFALIIAAIGFIVIIVRRRGSREL